MKEISFITGFSFLFCTIVSIGLASGNKSEKWRSWLLWIAGFSALMTAVAALIYFNH